MEPPLLEELRRRLQLTALGEDHGAVLGAVVRELRRRHPEAMTPDRGLVLGLLEAAREAGDETASGYFALWSLRQFGWSRATRAELGGPGPGSAVE